MVAYSVTVGNAGTGFRYRSHLVTLGICAMTILWTAARARGGALQEEQDEQDPAHTRPLQLITA
jgi:hypothetical protein